MTETLLLLQLPANKKLNKTSHDTHYQEDKGQAALPGHTALWGMAFPPAPRPAWNVTLRLAAAAAYWLPIQAARSVWNNLY